MTAVFTGLRASELRGLTWSAVDLDRRTLTVRQRADRWCVMGSPKSAAARREVPLAPIVLNALKEWRLACPPSELDLVFPTSTGPWRSSQMSSGPGRRRRLAGDALSLYIRRANCEYPRRLR